MIDGFDSHSRVEFCQNLAEVAGNRLFVWYAPTEHRRVSKQPDCFLMYRRDAVAAHSVSRALGTGWFGASLDR